MALSFFKDAVQKYTDAVIPVDEITNGNPLFSTSLWGETNNGFNQKYKELSSIIAAEAVDLNSVYPTVGADFNLRDKDIAFYAGTREIHVNTVDQLANGNIDEYLNEEMPLVFNQTLNNISFDFYYNVIRPFAKAKAKLVSATTNPSGNKYSSMFFVRWQEGQMQGLINGKWAGSRGGVFTATQLNGGNRYKNASNKSVYGVDVEMPIGFLPVNGNNVSGIVNIDLNTIQNDDLGQLVTNQMVMARPANGGVLKAYAPAVVIARLAQMKEAQQVGAVDNGIYSVLFNGVEMVGDWNMLMTEAPYTI